MSGVVYGLLAAATLGINQILITIASRRWGTVRSSLATLVIAFFAVLVLALAQGAEIPLDADGLVPLLLGLGLAAAIAYVTQYQSLRIGPVAVVSPIGATAGAVTVLFAFLLLGERPTLVQWIGIPIATLGAVLISLEIDTKTLMARLVSIGAVFAAVSVITGSISNAVLRVPVREIGGLQSILFQRAFTIAFVLLAFIAIARRGRLESEEAVAIIQEPSAPATSSRLAATSLATMSTTKAWLFLGIVGLLDAAAFVFFTQGLLVAPAWLIGLLSQSGRVIAVVGGLVLFREHLRNPQWVGIALVAVGLVLAVAGGAVSVD